MSSRKISREATPIRTDKTCCDHQFSVSQLASCRHGRIDWSDVKAVDKVPLHAMLSFCDKNLGRLLAMCLSERIKHRVCSLFLYLSAMVATTGRFLPNLNLLPCHGA